MAFNDREQTAARIRMRSVRTTPEAKWETRVIRAANDVRTLQDALVSLPKHSPPEAVTSAWLRMENAIDALHAEVLRPIG